MNNSITSLEIINTTLDLINEKEEIRLVNLREIARRLGCAHTNIYNYFPSLEQLLWKCSSEALHKFITYVTEDINKIQDTEKKIEYYFSRVIRFYLENRGLFKLIWLEKINSQRPKESLDMVLRTVDSILDIFYPSWSDKFSKEEMHYIVHNVHCYLHGEVFIYIAGRGLIRDEDKFKIYVKEQCIKLIKLYTT